MDLLQIHFFVLQGEHRRVRPSPNRSPNWLSENSGRLETPGLFSLLGSG